ncbi:hypothetical protein [Hydrogenophaga atypica]|uniref:Transposase n=1 Tax=Hydrogenophaga atypica TaxID=249409 RepID=A0ABW2QSZ5_9BURK
MARIKSCAGRFGIDAILIQQQPIEPVFAWVHHQHADLGERFRVSRPLKKCSSNAPESWILKKRVAQTGLRSDWSGHYGLFAGRFALFGRTYPMVHA